VKHLSKHLSFANAISCIALFIALSGAAYAATTTLGKKSVKTQNLANGSVTTLKLRGGSVTNLKLRNGAVTGAKIANDTIGSSQLANGAVRSEQLGGGVVTEAKLKDRAVGGNKIARGAITDFQLAPDAVGAGKILRGSITARDISEALLKQIAKNVSYVTKASLSNNSETTKSVFAECPFGKQVIGGGAQISGSPTGVGILRSAPAVGGDNKALSWVASAEVFSGSPPAWAVEAFAICAEF
jgi:trimeric autotransporter adhesin